MLKQAERCFLLILFHRASISPVPASLLVMSTQQTLKHAAEVQGDLGALCTQGAALNRQKMSHREFLLTVMI